MSPDSKAQREFVPVGAVGFEPTISWFRTRRIPQLSHTPLTAVIERKQKGPMPL
jgi:hypothetical protein